MSDLNPSETPNVVIENPALRKGINIAISAAGLVLGTAIVVDLATPAFDISAWTDPITAGLLYVGAFFGVAVTVPNIPKR